MKLSISDGHWSTVLPSRLTTEENGLLGLERGWLGLERGWLELEIGWLGLEIGWLGPQGGLLGLLRGELVNLCTSGLWGEEQGVSEGIVSIERLTGWLLSPGKLSSPPGTCSLVSCLSGSMVSWLLCGELCASESSELSVRAVVAPASEAVVLLLETAGAGGRLRGLAPSPEHNTGAHISGSGASHP